MISAQCEQAVAAALEYGNALLKFISANDCGLTRGHQSGFYLPKAVWKSFTPHPPELGKNSKHKVFIKWPDSRETESVITGYGQRTRSEYRLTRFGRGFPWLSHDMVGNLLVLIRQMPDRFTAYVLQTEEDIEEIQATLGLEITESWAVFPSGTYLPTETPDDCVQRHLQDFLDTFNQFPDTATLSAAARQTMEECLSQFGDLPLDDQLIRLVEGEYRLFRMVEDKICRDQIARPFTSIDEFLSTAATLMNRRKSRAGRSLENHFSAILKNAHIPFEQRVRIDGTAEPDILIPGKAAYENPDYPADKLCLLGLKTTCKDRWRQVLNEGHRVKNKHILTLQRGISANQLNEMQKSGITLVVPDAYRQAYPTDSRMNILTVETFVGTVRRMLA
jgi:type II restriction enzyme